MFKPAHELVVEAKKSIIECTAADIHERVAQPGALLIDVREPEEYRQGHLAGAINIPRGLLEFKISSEPALQQVDRPLAVYCKTGGRSALAALALKSMGFEHVVSLAGGFDGWVAEGRAVSKPKEIAFE